MINSTRIFWERVSTKPFIFPNTETIASEAVTTPDILIIQNKIYIYVGAVHSNTERIITFKLYPYQLLTGRPSPVPLSAQVVVDVGPNEFDCRHVFDPALIAINGEIYLYYSAIGEYQDSIGLAISKDGHNFIKITSPILPGRSPEIVTEGERLYLFYVKKISRSGYQIYCAISNDGKSFESLPAPVLSHGKKKDWDSYEVTTPRIFKRNQYFYMLYAGSHSSTRADMPEAFGLARSKDLIYWEKYPQNPVFKLGAPGDWDDGAIWFGTVFQYQNYLFLIYEGGRLENILVKSPALTQLGLASFENGVFDKLITVWS